MLGEPLGRSLHRLLVVLVDELVDRSLEPLPRDLREVVALLEREPGPVRADAFELHLARLVLARARGSASCTCSRGSASTSVTSSSAEPAAPERHLVDHPPQQAVALARRPDAPPAPRAPSARTRSSGRSPGTAPRAVPASAACPSCTCAPASAGSYLTRVSVSGADGGDGAARDRHAGQAGDGPRATTSAPTARLADRAARLGRRPARPRRPGRRLRGGRRHGARTASSSSRRRRPSCRAEARFLPVNWHLKADELAWILEDSGAQVLVAHHSLREYVDAALRARTRLPCADRRRGLRRRDRRRRRRRQRRLPVAGVHLLHVGHHGPAQGRRARRSHARRAWGWRSAGSRDALGLPRRRRAPARRARVPRRSRRLRVHDAVHRRNRRDPAVVGRPRRARGDRPPPRHDDVPDARPLHPHPRGSRGRARQLRPLEPAARHPRRRALSADGEAAHHRCVARHRGVGAVRRERGRRHARVARRVARAARHRRPAVAGRRGASCSTTTASRSPPATRASSTSGPPAARRSTTTATRRRPRRRGATARSPSATSAVSTTTATCTSPTASPTW